jgi:hypothetical protein
METQAPVSKDAAIIVKNITREDGHQGIELQLVFTRKRDDESPKTEAEEFGQFALGALAKLYEQLTNPPTTPVEPRQAPMRMGANHPGQNFTPPTIIRGEESDLKR